MSEDQLAQIREYLDKPNMTEAEALAAISVETGYYYAHFPDKEESRTGWGDTPAEAIEDLLDWFS